MSSDVPAELARGYICHDLPAIPGEVRHEPEDFEVEEVPLYEPSGEGEHHYLSLEKRGISTDEAIRRLARRLGVDRRKIGYAGLKDARAVTRQTISVQGAKAEPDPGSLGDDQLRVLSVRRHRNKLKMGHLLGNRFKLRVRGAGEHLAPAGVVLERLERRGVPNYFGLQRFGKARNTHRLGLALVQEDPAALCQLLLGGDAASVAVDRGRVLEAREAARAGDYARAAQCFPPSFVAEQSAARALAQGRDMATAVRAIPLKWRRFYSSAFQSWLFNTYLTRRLERLDQLELGEVATLHRNGAAFLVEALAREQERCAALEISPSGPSFGRKLLRPAPTSSAYADEQAVLADLAPGSEAELGEALGAKPLGQRRPLRTILSEAKAERDGDDMLIGFFLPKGCYATTVLEELFRKPTD